jgi:Xaa-Pro dipeptidase
MLNKLRLIAEQRNLKTLVISAPDNLEYFTGVPSTGDAMGLLAYDRSGDVVSIYVPLLEYQRYRDALPDTVAVYAVSRSLKPSDVPVVPLDWVDVVKQYAVDSVGVDLSHPGPLQKTILDAIGGRGVDVSNDVWRLRVIKDNREVNAVMNAVKVTIKGIKAVEFSIREDVTETQLVGVFERTVRDHGVGRLAFDPIVAFKPNNAYPHAVPGSRRIAPRDLVLIDVGVKINGRCSDLTRMILKKRPLPEERRSIEAVVEAVETAIDTIAPGVKASDVYEASARVLEKYGLREKFIHGLGHGIGVVVHEPPYLRHGSDAVLEPGMIFTIEPGVYIPGRYGVRVEEDVLVTKKGRRVLSYSLAEVLESL